MTTSCVDQVPASVDPCRHLRMGDIEATVRSDLPEILEDFDILYGQCRQKHAGQDPIAVEARLGRRSLWRGREYVVRAGGNQITTRTRGEVFPYLEWGINGRVIATRADYLQIHAATLVRDEHALLLVGGSGAGKSTLAAGLMARGWTYFCDELALIDPQNLRAHPFPKALCIKAGSFPAIGRLGLPLWRRRHYSKHFKGPVGYVPPPAPTHGEVLRPCPVRRVVFPEYAPHCPPRLHELSRAAAAFKLVGCTLNRHAFGYRAMPLACALVRRADCFRLEAGPLEATCDLIDALWAERG